MINTARLKKRLEVKRDQARNLLVNRHQHALGLLQQHGISLATIRHATTDLITSGLVIGSLLIPPAITPAEKNLELTGHTLQLLTASQLRSSLVQRLKALSLDSQTSLDSATQQAIADSVYDIYRIKAKVKLDGQRLNNIIGRIGYEQHLLRFPGDQISLHDADPQAGIAPHPGAWGYFAASKNQLTPDLANMERYYVAVQTLYLPNWSRDYPHLRDWYKHRKVIVINPANGNFVIAVIADAGPANWTGKQFGGSPEVMHELELDRGSRSGKVILMFVDDPNHKIPLGPLRYNANNQSIARSDNDQSIL